jgi:hypothetical protein
MKRDKTTSFLSGTRFPSIQAARANGSWLRVSRTMKLPPARRTSSRVRARIATFGEEQPIFERGWLEARPRKPVVERLVRNRDAVLMIELALQVSERLDATARESRDRREEKPVRRHYSKPLTLPGISTELVNIFNGQRACGRRRCTSRRALSQSRCATWWKSNIRCLEQRDDAGERFLVEAAADLHDVTAPPVHGVRLATLRRRRLTCTGSNAKGDGDLTSAVLLPSASPFTTRSGSATFWSSPAAGRLRIETR